MTGEEHRLKRVASTLIAAAIIAVGAFIVAPHHQNDSDNTATLGTQISNSSNLAVNALAKLAIKGRAPMTGYSRQQFGGDWEEVGACDMREHILNRDLKNVKDRSPSDCTVLSGVLTDPYTGKIIDFVRGPGTSTKVQIDHVVAIGDAWQTGAQQLSKTHRVQLYNDPLELLAVDGPTNEQKGDGDAATWLPPNKSYRCEYVARQIAVKAKYHLWVTKAEHDAMQPILNTCPTQQLPVVNQ